MGVTLLTPNKVIRYGKWFKSHVGTGRGLRKASAGEGKHRMF